MSYTFLGIISNTPTDESPTIWLDSETGDLLIQSYRATPDEVRKCQEVGSVPGHSTEVPDHEVMVRLPAEMLQYIHQLADQSNGEIDSATPSA
ncbi:hypothetical protein [Streptomyces sp. NPDC005438]|uniref:hypothetical protein n=1 Tax=Streptomyces sp. NPDC005438 TaxID=3156880 RepID=UPI0033BF6475